MLYAAFALFVLLLYRIGMFDEYQTYLEQRRFRELVGPVTDDVTWDDTMESFHDEHPHFRRRVTASMR